MGLQALQSDLACPALAHLHSTCCTADPHCVYVQTLQAAVSPTRTTSLDATLASVTDVQVSGDLQVAKVYVSISGTERGQEIAMEGLSRLRGWV